MSIEPRPAPLVRRSYPRILLCCCALIAGGVLSACSAPGRSAGDPGAGKPVPVSTDLAARFAAIGGLSFAQAHLRMEDGREALLLLARQDPALRRDRWIGGTGIELVTQAGRVVATRGLQGDIAHVEVIRRGGFERYLAGEPETALREGAPSIRFVRMTGTEDYVEEGARVIDVATLPFEGRAFTGRALRIVEAVRTTGHPLTFERVSWIDPASRELLRLITRLHIDGQSVVLEMGRIPDRNDPR